MQLRGIIRRGVLRLSAHLHSKFHYVACLDSSRRFYDLSRGASVHGMGPVLQHQAVPDDARTRGAEQSQLERTAERAAQQRGH